jgi:hypothetical protein
MSAIGRWLGKYNVAVEHRFIRDIVEGIALKTPWTSSILGKEIAP